MCRAKTLDRMGNYDRWSYFVSLVVWFNLSKPFEEVFQLENFFTEFLVSGGMKLRFGYNKVSLRKKVE